MYFDDKKFIGEKIKTFRRKAKLTQAELAERVELSEKHLGQIERGSYLPSLSSFFSIIKVLNINISEFDIAAPEDKNPLRLEIIKKIYSADEKELKFFHALLNCVMTELSKLNET